MDDIVSFVSFIRKPVVVTVGIAFFLFGCGSDRNDWPMWRYNPERQASADIFLPDNPELLWTRQLEDPERCWPFQYEDYFTGGNPDQIGKLAFDISYEPVAGEGKLFVPSMVSDRITAYSAKNGKELWRHYADGPVRFAPVYDSGRVYFVSDDGYLYCLDAGSGELLWNYKGSYSARKVLGNERMISMWPARGGPVIKDGVIYFASGVVPYEGVFIHAVDAESGDQIWTNSTAGAKWSLHQHGGAYSYGGPSPQGYLALSGDKLIVPGGRTPPAVFDKKDGEFLYFNLPSGNVGKGAGGYRAFATEDWFFNHGMLYALKDGAQYGHVPGDVITDEAFIGAVDNKLIAHDADITTTEVEITDRLERGAIKDRYEVKEKWSVEMDDVEHLYFKTDSHYVVSRNKGKTASLIPLNDEGRPGEPVWEYDVEGEIWRMFAADQKLYVVTREGKIYCFGKEGFLASVKHHPHQPKNSEPDKQFSDLAASILQKAGNKTGYGMIYKAGNSELIKSLTDSSSMHFVVVESDSAKVEMLRRRFDNLGIYGKRVAVIEEDESSSYFLPYIYNLIILNGDEPAEDIRKAFGALRPYGGTACFAGIDSGFEDKVNQLSLENGTLERENDFAFLERKGALPGSGQWTHQYSGSSNRTYSDDTLVKPPLGILWFGGPSNRNVLPRHHNGPIPQVAGGRVFLLGVETISARCAYTGRELWVKEIPGIGHPFTDLELEEEFSAGNEVYMSNHPGANFIGSPYVSTDNRVYIIHKDRLLSLDAATGELVTEFRLPEIQDVEVKEFGHVMVSGDYLITAIGPQIFEEGEQPGKENNWNATSSSVLLIMDRHSGEVLWTKRAEQGFRHNAIVADEDRVFMVDGLSEEVVDMLRRRGEPVTNSRLLACDLETGSEAWSVNKGVFGTWLGLYEDKGILLQGGRHGARRPLPDEPDNRLRAHNSLNGELLWEANKEYTGPLGLHPDMIIPGDPEEPAFDPETGEVIFRDHPITEDAYRWEWHKTYGCGTMNACRNLIAFRSGSAGYYDLLNFGGSGNISGWKAGCTNNLVPAAGILNAPDYTRTCTCSYPLQCSFAMAHMPDAGLEMWTFNKIAIEDEVIRSLGINFGAPGQRKEDDVLWVEYPRGYDGGPDLPVKIEPDAPEWFGHHATWIKNADEQYNWVASYGAEGISSISAELVPKGSLKEVSYTIALYFTEPDNLTSGERVFDVSIQGDKVLENFDVAQQAGGSQRVIRKEFKDIQVKDSLHIEFSNDTRPTVISGIEITMNNQTSGENN
ncbi:MAG: PQQ-binding-like beta-propeller repeat protein [Bacteroidales bacterium]